MQHKRVSTAAFEDCTACVIASKNYCLLALRKGVTRLLDLLQHLAVLLISLEGVHCACKFAVGSAHSVRTMVQLLLGGKGLQVHYTSVCDTNRVV